jgi:hypothetical protein
MLARNPACPIRAIAAIRRDGALSLSKVKVGQAQFTQEERVTIFAIMATLFCSEVNVDQGRHVVRVGTRIGTGPHEVPRFRRTQQDLFTVFDNVLVRQEVRLGLGRIEAKRCP